MSRAGSSGPRILVDPGGYTGANIGDAAMLAALLGRIRRRWPAAHVACHTLDPAWLHGLDAAAEPLDPGGAHAWNLEGAVAAKLGLPAGRCGGLLAGGRRLRRAWPGLGRRLARAARHVMRSDAAAVDAYLLEIARADLVIKAGAGALTDAFAGHAYEAIETLALGQKAGAVTALVGQGIGPIADRALRRRVAAVLARVDLVALRDGGGSRALVEAMGVPPDRVAVTGDDALALLRGRPAVEGDDRLGVNVRCARYAGLDAATIADAGRVFREQHAAGRRLVALPIDRHAETDDLAAVRRCVAPLALAPDDGPRTPAAFIAAVECCRAVVTGSYHGAVLALGSGVPVVGLAASPYYVHKLAGLAGQFGAACRVVDACAPRFEARLQAAIDAAWNETGPVRAALRTAAARQVAQGDAVFAALADRVDAGRRGSSRPDLRRPRRG